MALMNDDDMDACGYYFDESVEEEFRGELGKPSSDFGEEDPFSDVALTLGVRLERQFAVGHFGRVFVGQMADQRVCAKFLKPQQSIKAQRMQLINFQREVTLMSNLRHPNILRIICATHIPMMCIVTPLMVGGNLFEQVHAHGGLQLSADQFRVAVEVSSAMSYLHGLQPAPVVHRDLTSPNILLDADRSCKLSDFGLAKIKEPSLLEPSGQRGNLGWVAPEAMHQGAFDPASDVYSFGVILWELRSRMVPFAGCSSAEIRRQKLAGAWPPPSSLPDPGNDQLAKVIHNILIQCVQLNPEKRPTFAQIHNLCLNLDSTSKH